MPTILLTQFGGKIPKITPELLPNQLAQTALNCDLRSGSLDALKSITSIQAVTGTPRFIWKMGSTWISFDSVVSVVDSAIAETHNRIFWTDGTYPKKSDDTLWPSTKRLSIVAPTAAPVINISGTGDGETQDVISYVYTCVSEWGEESAPSPATGVTTIEGNQTVNLTGITTPAGSNNTITYKRIYRLSSGTAGAEYQYLGQIDETDTSFSDDDGSNALKDTQVDVLETEDWDAAPDALVGLTQAHNGMLVGYTGKELYISESWIPYAFPDNYVLTFDSDITAVGAFNEIIVVITQRWVYIVTGSDPGSLVVANKLGLSQSCVSQRGVVTFPGGVGFPTKEGLCVCDGSSVKILTEPFFTPEQWQALSPENLIGKYHNGKYYGFQNAGNTGFILDLQTGELTNFTLPTPVDKVYSVYQDAITDLLYLLVLKTDASYAIYSFETNATKLTYTWKSKIFDDPYAYTCAKIHRDSGTIVFKLYLDGTLIQTKNVTDNKAFRLLSRGGTDQTEIQLEGTTKVVSVQLATSVGELR